MNTPSWQELMDNIFATERSTVFYTPGDLDLRALTTFGLNVKPSVEHPIGYFGTGLKYAIAVILRSGYPIELYTRGRRSHFTLDTGVFRDKSYSFINLITHTGTKVEMPFTTELGKNWHLWQAFRELYSNTLDEKGSVFTLKPGQKLEDPNVGMHREETYIVVGGELFAMEYETRDKTFLPEAFRKESDAMRAHSPHIQVFDARSDYIYYRGIRVMDLKEPSLKTYNIIREIQLTEDRTAADPWMISNYIAKHIAQSEDPEVARLAITAPHGTYEHKLDYGYIVAPSPVFLDTVHKYRGSANISQSAVKLLQQERPVKLVTPRAILSTMRDHLQQENVYEASGLFTDNPALMKDVVEFYLLRAPAAILDASGELLEKALSEDGRG